MCFLFVRGTSTLYFFITSKLYPSQVSKKDFAKALNGSSNYFVLISRRDANELPYSVDEILKLVNTTSKTINGRKSDRRFYSVTKPLYDHTASMLYQDLNVGFEIPVSRDINSTALCAIGWESPAIPPPA